jgi:hypothetical protein
MNPVKVPESDTSDVDKINVRIFSAFFKIILTAAEFNPSFLISEKNLQYFSSFLKYLN